ncbi:MAG TPA: glycoside hydrolase family 38 C-terminal domain-containing protein [Capsulimonadaceae bacterium]|nr:glycoside hydrolase family 38 C-terminal domain-containing protein [Capsulimonadaceae bacterium]
MKEDYPEVYAGIKEAVARGQWEPIGGMWIESDCNVVSGESLVRQFLYGLRFYQREFGKHTNVVWLPDVFGYSAAFPQIIRKAGMKYFMTIKIFWNQVNTPPYQTFKWVGVDGTDVLVHFSPLGDYNAHMTPEQFKRNWDKYTQKNIADSCLYIYGWGDGGGGPTYQMLENAERAKDFPGTPKVQLSTAEAFFEDLDKQVSNNPLLPIWNGELYLEYHRGTYTSQGRNKRANRQSEILAQTAEQIGSLALLLADRPYAGAEITQAWETILLNQFHDIIPGSSIHEVYEDSTEDYARVRAALEDAAADALSAVAARVPVNAGEAVVYNPLSWVRNDVALAPASLGLKGQDVKDLEGNARTLIELSGKAPALGYAGTAGTSDLSSSGDLSVSEDHLENQYFRIDFDKNKEISSLIDKRAGREVIDRKSYCKGNALLTFEDKPMEFDAWDIDIYYQEKMYPLQGVADIQVVETGPIRASMEITRKIEGGRNSTIKQRISLYRNLPRIDFETEVDWHEKQTLLKVAFPATVNSLKATYDIQFSHIERPTYWNTSWDWARFEVCGHKWADLSEGDYGVSILSDCKYGWDIRDNVMRLTLLKSAIHPDPQADEGRNVFTYSLYPHAGDWRSAGTLQRAYELNVPVRLAAGSQAGASDLPASFSLASLDSPNLILETVKKAEDDDGLIVRLYEAYNQRGEATITFGRSVRSAKAVNLMENAPDGDDPKIDGSVIRFSYRPFEIKTFKVQLT